MSNNMPGTALSPRYIQLSLTLEPHLNSYTPFLQSTYKDNLNNTDKFARLIANASVGQSSIRILDRVINLFYVLKTVKLKEIKTMILES